MNTDANYEDSEQALTRLLDRRRNLEDELTYLCRSKEEEAANNWESIKDLYGSLGIYGYDDPDQMIWDKEEFESRDSKVADVRAQLEGVTISIARVNEEIRSLKETEVLYDQPDRVIHAAVTLTTLNDGFLRAVALNPELIYGLNSRRFEELVARILSDQGFSVELTPMTRDGGFDMLASVKNELGQFLTLVECKRRLPQYKIGVTFVRSLHGIIHLHRAHNAVLITTSSFSEDAIKESRLLNPKVELRDYEILKNWLSKYSLGGT